MPTDYPTDEIINTFCMLSRRSGIPEPALRLLSSLFFGYFMAFFYRLYIMRHKKMVHDLYMIACGIYLLWFNYGYEVYHSIIAITVSYLLIRFTTGKILIGGTFIFHMGYLLIGYYLTGTETYDIKWTMPHCVLVLRLIGLSFDIVDGQLPVEKMSSEVKKSALTIKPTILEIAAYTYFPASVLVGPQFPITRYYSFVNKEFSQYKNNMIAGFKRMFLGLIYLGLHQFGKWFFDEQNFFIEEFPEAPYLERIILLAIWGKYTLYKYISCWLLSEGCATCFGITFLSAKVDPNDETKMIEDWSGLANIKVGVFENASKFSHFIDSFNVNTNHWVAQYIYKRLKYFGNRHISQGITLLFLAIWHGFHSGYYMCFLMEFIVIYVERDFEIIVKSNKYSAAFINNPIGKLIIFFILKIYTIVGMGWCLIPFVFLSYDRWSHVYKVLEYFGFIVFLPWPILKYILRLILPSNKID